MVSLRTGHSAEFLVITNHYATYFSGFTTSKSQFDSSMFNEPGSESSLSTKEQP
jgi:hypothetical protein